MAPPALSVVYATEADVQTLLSSEGELGRVDDDSSGTISPSEQGYVTAAINYATARVNLYLLKLYTANDLATDWLVNQWAVAIACHWLSIRRGNPPPGSTKDLYEATIKDLEAVAAGQLHLDLGTRMSMFPAWSNVRVSLFNQLRKVVVERPISDSGGGTSAMQPAATQDVAANYLFDWR